jgi:hypothetical protein
LYDRQHSAAPHGEQGGDYPSGQRYTDLVDNFVGKPVNSPLETAWINDLNKMIKN